MAKKLASGEDCSADTAPVTLDSALNDYRRDLVSRNADPYYAEQPRPHLTSVLLSKPVALLTAKDLMRWRDGLLRRWLRRQSTGFAAVCALPWKRQRSSMNESRTVTTGKSALPVCPMRKKRATSPLRREGA